MIMRTLSGDDARRIVEAVNGLAEARRERDELRTRLDVVDFGREVARAERDDLRAIREQMNQRLTAVEAAMHDRVQTVERERDELRTQAPQAAPGTLAALEAAAARLTATIGRHEELLGIGTPKPDEIAKLRTVDATSWNVQIDGNNQCFRPCSADEARATYVHWRAKLAADYAVECADAAEDGDPKPEPPTLALVVEVVVDRWEP